MLSELATFIMIKQGPDGGDVNDIKSKPSDLWTECDGSCYGYMKSPPSALHKNPAGARGGDSNNNAAKRFHSLERAL